MAARKSINLLPSVFRTDVNDKFLSATLDQLISEPELKNLYGYIGRKFAPTYVDGDSYLTEASADRQNYQLEPATVITDTDDKTTFFSSYIDFLDKIRYYGGLTDDHSRLFAGEYYSFDPRISYDKFVNFGQYYWLPNGPPAVQVNTGGVELVKTFLVTRNDNQNVYDFSVGGIKNNTLILARGGTYTFTVNQSSRFWIQSELGTDGFLNATPTISSRDVLGVENNGATTGNVIFRVPQKDAQDRFLAMELVATVDFAVPLAYTNLQNRLLSDFVTDYPQYAGLTGSLDGKTLIFVDQQDLTNFGEEAWTVAGETDSISIAYDKGDVVAEADRYGIWKIQLIPSGDDYLVNCYPFDTVAIDQKVYVKYGLVNANQEFYRDFTGFFERMPLITSTADTLYIQDGDRGDIYTKIKIVDFNDFTIDVNEDILGQLNYTSPNGVEFTSGLKIQFDVDVTPASYQNNVYYVENVGDSIRLVDTTLLVTPEEFNDEIATNYPVQQIVLDSATTAIIPGGTIITVGGIAIETNTEISIGSIKITTLDSVASITKGMTVSGTGIASGTTVYDAFAETVFPDYITIKRDALDLNSWARHNRWFHVDVIKATAEYNDDVLILDQRLRAQRPIVQFETDLQLFNHGRIGKKYIDILDTNITDAFNQLEGQLVDDGGAITYNTSVSPAEVFYDGVLVGTTDTVNFIGNGAFGVTLFDGMRVLFAADEDPLVRDKIYVVNLVQFEVDTLGRPEGAKHIKLTIADDGDAEEWDSVVVRLGQYKGSAWWYNGSQWLESQQKTSLQQDPLFDVYDIDGRSLSDTNYYPRSTFAGTRVFGYQRNANGTSDPVLNFGLSYRSFQSQGDILFSNYFNTDTFEYVVGQTTFTKNINVGFLQSITNRTTTSPRNTWRTVVEPSRQYQILSFVYDGTNSPFKLDVTPNAQNVHGTTNTIPYVKVYKNKTYLTQDQWTISTDNTITLVTDPVEGDTIDVEVYSDQVSQIGYYQVPLNLDLNAQNIDVSDLTLGQIRNHLVELSRNSTNLDGDVLGPCNLRDIEIKAQGGTILQHSAPLPYAELFLLDSQANFIDAVKLAQREYTKFKNKFLELSSSLSGIDPEDPIASVDLILAQINLNKTPTGPWFYSDMVPYGTLKNTITYTVFDPLVQSYEITSVFSSVTLSNQAVLVYLNNEQLILGIDYTFDTDRPAVTFNEVSVSLEVDDVITIVEYSNTDGSYVPETPSKLGTYPKFKPEKVVDDTYRTSINVVRGHDGSIIPAFNDYRDDFLLELEKRIYNNIKLPDTGSYRSIYSLLPGKFRDNGYTYIEMWNILSKNFLTWVGNNRIADFSSNDTFSSNDGFTWNYSRFVDRIDGEYMPGSWRAVYEYFYDTIYPHTRPWEMLGFTTKPDWWEDYYGPAPYTGGNKLLWDDLEAGLIRFGDRAGVDKDYARPGLATVIPVDENGILLNPAQVIAKAANGKYAATAWSVGQLGPVEWAWRTSSEFPFAVQQAMAVAKPGMYFGQFIDTYQIQYNSELEQYLTRENHHLRQTDITYNGDSSSGAVVRSAGYLNWIADYLRNLGINPSTKITTMLENYNVKLAYKMAGFTDKKYLQILAEQSSPTSTNASIMIPEENYDVVLYKSTPVDKITYSAVILEKTTNGFTVRGYDLNSPYFTIIPSIVNNNAYKITVLNSSGTVFNDYQKIKITVPYGYEFKSKQQVVDFLISYERYLIAQGFTFNDRDGDLGETRNFKLSVKEFLFWAQQGWKTGTLLVMSPVTNSITLTTVGNIVDEITDSQHGSKIVDQNFNLVRNTGYQILRSPTGFKVTLSDDNVLGLVELNLVQYEHVLTFDNTTVFNDVIYKPELGNRQYRLRLIGQKTDAWDGSLYAPGFVYNSETVQTWQSGRDYLKGELVLFKDQYYVALANVPAAVDFDFSTWKLLSSTEIKTGLLRNWSTLAVGSQSFYDSYGDIKDNDQLAYSHGLIGFKPRQYLSDLGVSDTTQIEFYKGYIRQKGSTNAVDALTKANFNNLSGNISLYEEWAVRTGEYGALTSNPYIEIALDERAFSVNPAVAEFVDTGDSNLGDGVTIFNKSQLYRSTDAFDGNIAINRDEYSDYDNDILTAGYVNLEDVSTTIFDITDYTELNDKIADIGNGYTIWCARDFSSKWNVYRVSETETQLTELTNALDGYITWTTDRPHGLAVDDVFLVRDFDNNFNGFYQVYSVLDLNRVTVIYQGDPDNLEDLNTLTGQGILFVLKSLRFRFMEDSRVFGLTNPLYRWRVGEKIWIDEDAATNAIQGQPYDTPSGGWKVYEKTEPWSYDQTLIKSSGEYKTNDGYGTSVKLSYDGLLAVVGSPFANSTPYYSGGFEETTGRVNTFDKNYADEFVNGFTLVPTAGNAAVTNREFGYSVDQAIGKVAVGAPGSYANIGLVYVYSRVAGTTDFTKPMVVWSGNAQSGAGDRFGSSISLDQNGTWLYVGAPGNDRVYVYGLNTYVPIEEQIIAINSNTSTITTNFTPAVANSAESLQITNSNRVFIPNLDYTLSGNVVTFTDNPITYDVYVIKQQPYYVLSNTIQGPSGSDFGYSMDSSLDGAQLGVGAPSANVLVGNTWVQAAGAVYVYDRVIEAYESTGLLDYTTTGTIDTVHRVTIDNEEVTNYTIPGGIGSNTIRFINPPPIGKTVYIETNQFNLLEQLIGVDSLEGGTDAIHANAAFGTDLTICSNNCAIYVGAPYYNAGTNYNTGAVWKFHNKGRLYGTNRGFRSNPVFTPGDTLRLDNFEITVQGRLMPTAFDANVAATITGVPLLYVSANILALSSNIVANVGQVISQNLGSGYYANVVVLANTTPSTSNTVVGSKFITVGGNVRLGGHLSANVFNYGPGNVVTLYANTSGGYSGTVSTAYPMASLDSLVKDINDAELLGITAENQNNFLSLDTNKTVAKNLLRVLTGTNRADSDGVYAAADMKVFAFMQIIVNPYNTPGEYFGNKVVLAQNAYMLVIGSERGTTRSYTTLDDATTTLDVDSTRFFDAVTGSGSVYIYELYDDPRDAVEDPGRYAFAQQLKLPNTDPDDPDDELNTGDRFGAAIDIIGTNIIVSAPGDDTSLTDAGSVYIFANPAMTRGWNLIRYQQDKVDVESVNRIFLYSNLTNTILTNLEFIDPAKGKILGVADQEITYKTEYDPAVYNRGSNANTEYYWGAEQVNQVWWNLNQVRFIDYEQGSLTYRSINWGRLFPGSVVEVCEWVESTVLPSQYVDAGFDGTPKYPDDSQYVEILRVDPNTNIIGSIYYFWVTNKTSLTGNDPRRTLPIQSIANYISDPKAQGIAYAAIIKKDAIILYNVGNYLSAQNTILHLDYDLLKNNNVIHSEYELIQKSNPVSLVPDKISAKMIDSLAGIDMLGRIVPDPRLSLADRYGTSVRPRQSMFIDRLRAMSDLIDYVNSVLIVKPIARQYDLSTLSAEEDQPSIKLGEYDIAVATEEDLNYIDTTLLPTGYKVLVEQNTLQDNLWSLHELQADKTWDIVRIQSYKSSLYWEYVDWYAEGYNETEVIEYVVDTLPDALKLPVAVGDEVLVRVNNTTGGGWNLLTVLADGSFSVVGIENGTIQLKTSLSNFADNGIGLGNQGFDSSRFDQSPNVEIRYIIEALKNDIFIDELQGEYNKLFFVMMNYLFSEQKYVDWIFKTSFVSVTHYLRSLVQPSNYIKDNISYYENYIEEVKPYITKIREYLTSYSGDDKFEGSVTDFDLAPYYDPDTKIFRSPDGSFVEKDRQLWATGYLISNGGLINPDYPQWYQNRNFYVDEIIITNPGRGYATEPTITIIGGGANVQATATAEIDGDTGAITSITVLTSGNGYYLTPTVIINGSADEPATAYAVLRNDQLRTFDTTIKFDRVSYGTTVEQWAANSFFSANTIVSYEGQGYRVLANITTGSSFVVSDYRAYSANSFNNANDRIMAYYDPSNTMPAKDLNQLVYGIEYPGVKVQGLDFNQQPGFSGEIRANITFNTTISAAVGDVITQPEADVILNFSNVITANIGQTVSQYQGAGVYANAIVYGNTMSNGTTQGNITSSLTGYFLKTTDFTFDTTNQIFVDDVRQFSNVFVANAWSNIAVKPISSTIGGITTVEVAVPDATITVTKVWSDVKVQGTISTSSDFIVGNVANASLRNGNIKIGSSWVSAYPINVDYVSTTAGTPFDSGDYDNIDYDEDGNPMLSENSIDTIIRSTYLDTALGTRPEDIDVDGGAYVDTYSSHAPEELVPGRTFDTLDLKVYTKIDSNANVIAYRIFDNMVDDVSYLRIAASSSTRLASNLYSADTTISVDDATALPVPDVDNNIPGVVFIGAERITYWTANTVTNTLGQIRRGTQGTAAANVHLADALVVDGSIYQNVPGSAHGNVTLTIANTYTVTNTISYNLRLNRNISANVGDVLTQTTSGASATVIGANLITSSLLISYNGSVDFNYSNVTVALSGNLQANIGSYITQASTGANLQVVLTNAGGTNVLARYTTMTLLSLGSGNLALNGNNVGVYPLTANANPVIASNLAVNGTYSNVYPFAREQAGYNVSVVAGGGNVTVGSGNVLITANVWYNAGSGVAADGTGFDGSTTSAVAFLKASKATTIAP